MAFPCTRLAADQASAGGFRLGLRSWIGRQAESLDSHANSWYRISTRDRVRLGHLYLQGGEWQGAQVVPAAWVEESTRSYSATGEAGTYSGYGYMWWVAEESLAGIKKGSYAASGWGSHSLEVFPLLNRVVVIRHDTDDPAFTGDYAGASADELILRILEARLDR